MAYTKRTRRGYLVTSGPVAEAPGTFGWACGCGASGKTGANDQQADLDARSHAMHCGRPPRRRG